MAAKLAEKNAMHSSFQRSPFGETRTVELRSNGFAKSTVLCLVLALFASGYDLGWDSPMYGRGEGVQVFYRYSKRLRVSRRIASCNRGTFDCYSGAELSNELGGIYVLEQGSQNQRR